MMKPFLPITALLGLVASPAFAASGKFVSLGNTNFIVLLAFIAFIGVLIYFKVPSKIGEMLDTRAKGIENDLNEARALRDEAQTLLASYERKQREVEEKAKHIVSAARDEAEAAAERAKEDIAISVQRRLAAAEEKIKNAEKTATKEVKDQAVSVAIAAAQDVYSSQMTSGNVDKLIDDAIDTVGAKIH